MAVAVGLEVLVPCVGFGVCGGSVGSVGSVGGGVVWCWLVLALAMVVVLGLVVV